MLLLAFIAGLVILLLVARWVARKPPRVRRKWLLYGGLGVLVALALSGRLHWLAAAIGATLPLLYKLFALVRFVPLFTRIFHNLNLGSQGFANFQSRSLVLEINPLTGTMDGRVLAGAYKGRRLSSFNKSELEALMAAFVKDDPQAAQLLQSYQRMRSRRAGDHGDHGDHGGDGGGDRGEAATPDMSRDQALRILGLKPDAKREAITEAHRRLIQKLHPDRGGSAHLAALINQAKDLLLQ